MYQKEAAREQKQLDKQAKRAKTARAANWGYFTGDVDARWENDGLQDMVLLK